MKKVAVVISLFLGVCLEAHSGVLEHVYVTGVTDGDTIHVVDDDKNRIKIRFLGIDSPEKRRQPYGKAAKQYLSDLIYRKTVDIRFDDNNKKDRYGRTLGFVLLDGENINLEMVRAGYAWVFRRYDKNIPASERDAFYDAEKQAREAGRGLWGDSVAPVEPWEWRRARKNR